MPLPIVEPMTTATARQRPRRRARRSPQRSAGVGAGAGASADMGATIYGFAAEAAHISRFMTRSFTRLAWGAAVCTYLLIVLGAVVRITGSGMGCGDHWPLWHGRLFPPLDDLGTAMLLLATLIVVARGPRGAPPSRAGLWTSRAGLWALVLGFVTVLLGALTANLGAASACLGFPLCNGQIIPEGNYLQHIHWI